MFQRLGWLSDHTTVREQAKTAFMYFSAARRAEVKEADPSLSFGDIAKRIAELWKAATPDEKAPFEGDAAQDKVPLCGGCSAVVAFVTFKPQALSSCSTPFLL